MASASGADPERQPLLPRGDRRRAVSFEGPSPRQDTEAGASVTRAGSLKKKSFSLISPRSTPREDRPVSRGALWERIHNLWRGPVVDSMTYKADALTSWRTVLPMDGVRTAFQSQNAWEMLGKLAMLSVTVAIVVVFILANPAKLRSSKFQKIAVFLRIFVGLLLGFFLTSSVNRWFECTKGFLELHDAIRNLQIQLLALGVPKHLRFKVVRYGVVSGWLLGMTLQIETIEDASDKADAVQEMYASLREEESDKPRRTTSAKSPKESAVDRDETPDVSNGLMHRFTVLSKREVNALKGATDPATLMWIWVASLVGRMSQDGWLPPMQSPTYGFVMGTVQEAHLAIRNVRQSVWIQAPFIYVHMLASLVHVNNIVNAISFGIVLGSTVGTGLQYHNLSILHSVVKGSVGEADIVADAENLFVSFVISLIGPFLYQVLLEVSVSIAQPFNNSESQIPTDRLMNRLQKDLTDAVRMASDPPSWEVPFYKERPHSDTESDYKDSEIDSDEAPPG